MATTIIVVNLARGYRYQTLKGKRYLTVPMVMLTEGVHEGNATVTSGADRGKRRKGGVLYAGQEIAKSATVWNMKPVIVYHPKGKGPDGVPLSGTDVSVLEETQVGFVMNSKWDASAKKLRGEAWLDEDELRKVAPKVLDNIKKGRPTEVSTGLSMDVEDEDGEFGGSKYSMVAMHFRPDHLAVLPTGVGACSVDKGAGLCVMNAGGVTEAEDDPLADALAKSVEHALKAVGGVMVENELSFSDVHRQLQEQLGSKYGEKGKSWYGYIVDVYPDYCVFVQPGSGPSRYMAQKYTTSDTAVALNGAAVEVTPVRQYQTDGGQVFAANESPVPDPVLETSMNRKAFETYLIENCGYTAEELAGKSDDEVLKLKPKAATATVTNSTPPPVVGAPPVTPPAQQPLTWAQIENMADPKIKAQLKAMRDSHDAEVGRLVTVCTENGSPFSKEYLTKVGEDNIELLRGIAHPYLSGTAGGGSEPPMFRTGGQGPFGGAGGGPVHVTNARGGDEPLDTEPLPDTDDRLFVRNSTGRPAKRRKKARN